MTGLYPIIRRPRRSLIPLDEPAPPVPPQAVELPPVVPLVSTCAPVMASGPAPAPASPESKPARKRTDEAKRKES